MDDKPLYYVINDGVVTEERLHRHDATSVEHFIKGDVVIQREFVVFKTIGKVVANYRRLVRCSARSPGGTCIGNSPGWTQKLEMHQLPPVLQLYLTLSN